MRVWIIAVSLIGLWACDEGSQKEVTIDPDQGSAGAAGGGEAGSGAAPEVDGIAPEVDSGAAGEVDGGGVDSGTAGVVDSGMVDDAAVDGGAGGTAGAEFGDAQIALSSIEDTSYLIWSDARGVFAQIFSSDISLNEAVQLSETPADFLEALAVNGVPWLAWSLEGEPISLVQADLLQNQNVERYTLNLRGKPLLSTLDDDLLVMGQDEGGKVRWQLLDADDPPEDLNPLIESPLELPLPDSAVGMTGGALLRFDQAGQCVQLDGSGQAVGNFPCLFLPGRLLSDGVRPVLSHRKLRNEVYWEAVSPLFWNSVPYEIMVEGLSFPDDGRERAILGQRNGLLQLAFLSTDELWFSEGMEFWNHEQSLAALRRGESAHLFSFDEGGVLIFESLPLTPHEFPERPWGFSEAPCISPSAERCDEVDHDCNGENKNGLCCQEEPIEIGQVRLSAPLEEIRTFAQSSDNTRILMVRTGETHWTGWEAKDPGRSDYMLLQNGTCIHETGTGCIGSFECVKNRGEYQCCETTGEEEEYRCVSDEPEEGGPIPYQMHPFSYQIRNLSHAFSVNGTYFALIGEDPDSGELSLWWQFYNNNYLAPTNLGNLDIRERIPIGCDRILTAERLSVVNEEEYKASILVVCPDRIRRIFLAHREGTEDQTFMFSEIGNLPQEINWATATRVSDAKTSILVFYYGSDGVSVATKRLDFAPGFDEFVVVRALEILPEEDLLAPIWLHRNPAGTPLQISEENQARVLLPGSEWASVFVGLESSQSLYDSFSGKLLISAEIGENLGFWVFDLPNSPRDLNLWSMEPAYTHRGALPFWSWTLGGEAGRNWDGEYSKEFLYLEPGEREHQWRVFLQGFNCMDP